MKRFTVDSHNPNCRARRFQDGTMRCVECRFQWDIDDPEPPACVVSRLMGKVEFVSGLPNVPEARK